ncbi:GNAT family N-acetyltransferase [Microbacterium sp. JZ31]|uniref:GNAT family N-acetyltransferase n=1 Tax=Microbacterium sp. JZ31 TaxID=1906274 RepID=UPI0019341FA2|nr:GNAT family N-acetyltransferase [Microbacterium sp. JZ31]
MVEITTRPATLAEWDDVQAALTGGGDGRSCQCVWPLLGNREFGAAAVEQRRDLLHDEIQGGPPPGLVAYVDGEAAGWIRIGPRPAQQRIVRSRVVKSGSAEPLDDASVWAVTCFSVRKEHRRQGINAALLDAAVAYARTSGARVIEGYPIATDTTTPAINSLFVGALSTYLRAGFREVARPTEKRVVVALEL